MSPNLEYWCPMCPGVVSDWPGKCPVYNMVLVRRDKGEPAPLPDGVVARMQFSPYRVQLAGIRTATVESRPLRREILMVGTVGPAASSWVAAAAEVFEKDRPFLAGGLRIEAASDLLPGHVPFAGEVATVEACPAPANHSFRVLLKIHDPGRELRPGTLVTARAEVPVTRLAWWSQAAARERSVRAAAELTARVLLAPAGPSDAASVASLVRRAVTEAMDAQGLGLAIPHSAVIDHGPRKVAFVESGAGMFDAVEVAVGPRCGDFYPVLRGVEAGQHVAAAGAFLLDAEMWLNHDLAAAFFGATRGGSATPAAPQQPLDLGPLSVADRSLADRQQICPVSGQPLDSMGGPVRVDVASRTVFVCCKGCVAPLRNNPEKYLPTLPRE